MYKSVKENNHSFSTVSFKSSRILNRLFIVNQMVQFYRYQRIFEKKMKIKYNI